MFIKYFQKKLRLSDSATMKKKEMYTKSISFHFSINSFRFEMDNIVPNVSRSAVGIIDDVIGENMQFWEW